jgi:lipoprotein-anchoring transpeptidase ErfK/SrfK
MIARALSAPCLLLALTACGRGGEGAERLWSDGQAAAEERGVAIRAWDARLPGDELARDRRNPAWQRVVQLDSIGPEDDGPANPEEWDQISAEVVNTRAMHLPLHGEVAGPSVLRAQILLDRALFSPGIIDGHWGMNSEKAAYWFQRREGLRATGRVDDETFARMVQRADAGEELIRSHTLSAEDVEGPFVTIPEDIYDKAELDCLCYESLSEKLGELFHTSPAVLQQLNPEVELESLSAGDRIEVPNVRDPGAGRSAQVARIVVSGDGFYVHALDAAGSILFHFPTTLGSSYDPSPAGDHRVTSITRDPWWHYQPAILAHVDDEDPEALIPPGPNNAVGLVWMALSIPHYGIHGTSAPETIGYVTSAGCVRLTNWDALFLADRISPGVPVEFRSTR